MQDCVESTTIISDTKADQYYNRLVLCALDKLNDELRVHVSGKRIVHFNGFSLLTMYVLEEYIPLWRIEGERGCKKKIILPSYMRLTCRKC